jgi:hypothetical protein
MTEISMVKFVVTAGSVLAMLAAGTALGQSTTATGNSQIGSLTCGDIAALPIANQAALIYYAAGYRDGLVDGAGGGAMGSGSSTDASGSTTSMSSANDTSGVSSSAADSGMSSAESGSGSTTQSGASGSDNGLVGGLGLDAQLVVTACATSADALLTDVIGTSGGTSGTASGGASGSSGSSGGSSSTGSSSEMSTMSESSSAAGDSGTSGASSSAQ